MTEKLLAVLAVLTGAASHEAPRANALPTKAERAAIRRHIRESAPRPPVLRWLTSWLSFYQGQMSRDDYEKARGLYLRFLDNFARIKTASFCFELHGLVEETELDMPSPPSVENIFWTPSKDRVETLTSEEGEEPEKHISVSNGRDYWRSPRRRYRGRRHFSFTANIHLYRQQLARMRERWPGLWDDFTHCEIDDGSTGFSRVWSPDGAEVRFDTATGMLTYERDKEGKVTTRTYQSINGLWFPLEILCKELGTTCKEAYSRVVLNEPLDEALFDMPPLPPRPPARDRFRSWRYLRKTRIYRPARVNRLYARFVDNFAKIETARFHVEQHEIHRDGQEKEMITEDVVWVPSRKRVESRLLLMGEPANKEPAIKQISIFNNGERCHWFGDSEGAPFLHTKDDRKDVDMYDAGSYLFYYDLDALHRVRPVFEGYFTNCEMDDGSTGFSRVFLPGFHEMRFDTTTGLITEDRGYCTARTYTYQQVNGLWFPLEVCEFKRDWDQAEGPLTSSVVFSQVVLNEPVDEALFQVEDPH